MKPVVLGDESEAVDTTSVDAGTVKENAEPEPLPSEPEHDEHEQHLLDTESQQQIEHLVKRLERRH